MPEPVSRQASELTAWQSFLHGSIAGGAEVSINQPFASLKCEFQKMEAERRISLLQMFRQLNARVLYSGAGANAVSMAGVTGIQMLMSSFFKSFFSDGGALPLSDSQKVISASLAGASGALFACPGELLMDHQREMMKLYDKRLIQMRPTYVQTLKGLIAQRGPLSPFRGFALTATRDAGFTTAYQVGAEYVSRQIKPYTGDGLVNKIAGGIVSGVVGAAATHPLDTRKTKVQSWIEEPVFKPTLRKTFADSFKGFVPRTLRVASAVTVLNVVLEKLKALTLSDTK